jgi:phycocyanobilin lyase alpha subunit
MGEASHNLQASSPAGSSAGGESLTVEQAIANLQGDDLSLRIYAAWWLGRFRVSEPAAVKNLIQALADEDDRTSVGGYPLRRNAARALGKLGDRQAVLPLIQCLSCSDFYVREAAAQSLEMLGDPAGIPALIQLLENQVPGTLAAPEQLDLAQPYDAILEALGTLQAREAIPTAKSFLEHPVDRVRYAAARALYQLTPDPQEANQYGELLVQALSGKELQLRRAALADLGAIGYLPAATAISQTHAENSLKLIALKGLLENQVNQTTPPALSEGAINVMALMDELL